MNRRGFIGLIFKAAKVSAVAAAASAVIPRGALAAADVVAGTGKPNANKPEASKTENFNSWFYAFKTSKGECAALVTSINNANNERTERVFIGTPDSPANMVEWKIYNDPAYRSGQYQSYYAAKSPDGEKALFFIARMGGSAARIEAMFRGTDEEIRKQATAFDEAFEKNMKDNFDFEKYPQKYMKESVPELLLERVKNYGQIKDILSKLPPVPGSINYGVPGPETGVEYPPPLEFGKAPQPSKQNVSRAFPSSTP
jgi:hypothetical protein